MDNTAAGVSKPEAFGYGWTLGIYQTHALAAPVAATILYAADHPVLAAIYGSAGALSWFGWGKFYGFAWTVR